MVALGGGGGYYERGTPVRRKRCVHCGSKPTWPPSIRVCAGRVQGYLAHKKHPPPYDPPTSLGIGLRQGPKGVRFLVSEAPAPEIGVPHYMTKPSLQSRMLHSRDSIWEIYTSDPLTRIPSSSWHEAGSSYTLPSHLGVYESQSCHARWKVRVSFCFTIFV